MPPGRTAVPDNASHIPAFGGVAAIASFESLLPRRAQRSPFSARTLEERPDLVGNVEVGLDGPARSLLGRANLVGSERGAVGVGGVLLVRSALGDVRPAADPATVAPSSASALSIAWPSASWS